MLGVALLAAGACADGAIPAAPEPSAAREGAAAVGPVSDVVNAGGSLATTPVATGATGLAEVRIVAGARTQGFVARGPVMRGVIGRKGSGGYTDASGRVVQYRDSVAVPSTQLPAYAVETGESLSLNIAGVPPEPGRYEVVPSGVRPPWNFGRAFGVTYAVGGCNHVYVAQSGTLLVTAAADGGRELAFDATLRATPLFIYDPSVGFTCRGGTAPALESVRATGRVLLPPA